MTIQRTDAVSRAVKALIQSNGNKFFSVTFIKKDGSERTLVGHIRKVEGHNGHNNASHVEKYITVVLTEKDAKGNEQFRNVNCETIKSISMGGRKIQFD